MKTKLLKKVRKRYAIFKFPNGVKLWNTVTNAPTFILYDDKDVLSFAVVQPDVLKRTNCSTYYFNDEVEAFKELQEKMLKKILYNYDEYGTRRNSKLRVAEKIYFKNENITNK